MSLFKKSITVAVVVGVCSFALSAAEMTTSSTNAKADVKTTSAAKVEKSKLAPQTLCPVMGADIDKSVFVDYNGKRVYFCCSMCPPTFKKDPEKYIKKLESMGQGVEPIPATPKADTKGSTDTKGMDHSKM